MKPADAAPPERLRLPRVVAVDGPSASGKGTLSRRLAAELGFAYVDTGAMYRTLAWWALRNGLRLAPPMTVAHDRAVVRLMRSWNWDLREIDRQVWLHVEGYFPAAEIRTDPVEKAAAVVAQIGRVRDWMVARQRECVRFGPLVMEGRDIGTEVFPLATVKFFLDADADERQRRLASRGGSSDVRHRDGLDQNRRQGALVRALDAVCVDSTRQTEDETFDLLRQAVVARLTALPAGA